jgi:predicted GIY-YIG superfamily endonuclease
MKKTINIIDEIHSFVAKNGGDYKYYYIGITNDPERRIVEDANSIVMEHIANGRYTRGMPWYHAECLDQPTATRVEEHFQLSWGMKKHNPRSRGKPESKFVYCFKMTEKNLKNVLNEDNAAVPLDLRKLVLKAVLNRLKTYKEFLDENH